MIAEQLALNLSEPAAPDEVGERLRELISVLEDNGGWMTRRELEGLGFDERELRLLGEHDEDADVFSYPGSPGYKLTALVTEKEFSKCLAWKSQGRKMLRRFVRLQRRRHRLFPPSRGTADAVG